MPFGWSSASVSPEVSSKPCAFSRVKMGAKERTEATYPSAMPGPESLSVGAGGPSFRPSWVICAMNALTVMCAQHRDESWRLYDRLVAHLHIGLPQRAIRWVASVLR